MHPLLKREKNRLVVNVTVVFLIAVVLSILLFGHSAYPSHAQEPGMGGGFVPLSTPWRPNRKDLKYSGPAACVKCHEQEAANQHLTAMGRALEPVASSEILKANPKLTFRSGPFSHSIIRSGDQSIYSVTDGQSTFSEPILYSFGQGKAGQTYVFKHNGSFYESRLSFYRDIQGLDVTIGYPRDVPPSLEVAAGREISIDEARHCFSCHSTGATFGNQMDLNRLIPGVTCEACHGPGADHIAAMEAKQLKDKKIFNPGHMSADEMSQDFCGSCHRSAEQVIGNKLLRGLISVRFQPYRMFTSTSHDPADMRLTCVACHNPHENPVKDESYYDAKCFACHRSQESLKSAKVADAEQKDGRANKPCPVSNRLCVSCHMPKTEFPGSHFKFTDHRIRIARPGDPFPG